MEDFSKYIIKEYKYWEVSIKINQTYLGSCIIWCKRENALDLTDATKEEREELFLILKKVKEELTKIFQPNWFNYSFLGNETRHLHCHLIPRYSESREFEGVKFEDKLFGRNWKTDHVFSISEDILEKIRQEVATKLTEK